MSSLTGSGVGCVDGVDGVVGGVDGDGRVGGVGDDGGDESPLGGVPNRS